MLADKPGILSMTEYWQSIQSHVLELGEIHLHVFNHSDATQVKKIYDEAIGICEIGLQLESQGMWWLANHGPQIKTWSKALIKTVESLKAPETDDPRLKQDFPKLMVAFIAMYISHLAIYREGRVVPTSTVIKARNQKYITEAQEDFEAFCQFHIFWVEACNVMDGDVRHPVAHSNPKESFHGDCCLNNTCDFSKAYEAYKRQYKDRPLVSESGSDTMTGDPIQYKRK